MKIRKRLYPYEAELLGLQPKEPEQHASQNRNQNRYYITLEQWDSIKKMREEGLGEVFKNQKVDPKDVKHLWKKEKGSSLFIKNPLYQDVSDQKFAEIRQQVIDDLKKFSPKFPKLKREKSKDPHLLVIDPADVHLGKLCSEFETGDKYNNEIAIKRCHEGVEGILTQVSGWNIDKILFVAGNDILHVDTPRRTTTSGTPQDTDGMWYDNFLLAKNLYVDLLMKLLSVADVHFVYNPSNHDYQSGFFLADVVQTYFRNCKNITFDCSMAHRKTYRYGNNLIGTTHGDGAKTNDLALLMASESKDWSECKRRYCYAHHVHHKVSKDFIGCTFETLRSPSGTDSWHHRQGYQHAPKAIEGFLHHKEHGQVARLTHYF